MLSDDEKAAVAVLLTRYEAAWRRREKDQVLAKEINERVTAQTQIINNITAAFEVFGLKTTGDGWKVVKETIGEQVWDKAIAAGRSQADAGRVIKLPKVAPVPAQKEKTTESEKPEIRAGDLLSSVQETPTVRDAILARLQAINPESAKASELGSFLEKTYSMKLHSKTVGMTLYRLSQDKKVRREGRNWFFVPPEGEAKNPGGDTPGPETSQK